MVQTNIDLLLGVTASGKTAYIKEHFSNREIINCDSRQIYKFFDIGTAKPDRELLKQIKHHLIDICEINEDFTVMKFLNIVKELLNEPKDYIISAGTPFYINTLINGISPLPKIKKQTKEYVKQLIDNRGVKEAYSILMKVDKKRAEQLSENDTFRISRALEVYFETNKPISEFFNTRTYINIDFNRVFYIDKSKELLSKYVIKRTGEMIDKGLIDETERLCEKYGIEMVRAKKIIGYNETIDYMHHNDIEKLKNDIYKNTMQYIKVQKTFFKKIINNLKYRKLTIIH